MVEYVRGQCITPEVWELSPLDASIYEYECRCKDYFYRQAKPKNETKSQRTQRLDGLKSAKAHLNLEGGRIMALISVDEQLQQYRSEHSALNKPDRIIAFQNEKHHPTSVLENNLRLAGRVQPSSRYSAHHIVEGKGKLADTRRVRMTLFRNNIRINDPDNGVWMPMTDKDRGHWAMPKCPPHMRIHTKSYERWVFTEIQHLKTERAIRDKLERIRSDLKYGKQPLTVTTEAYNKKFGLIS